MAIEASRMETTAVEVPPQKTTGQDWLHRSSRQGFNLPEQGIMHGAIVTRLPNFQELKAAAESVCGQKFFVIEEKRRDYRSGRTDVPCATVGVLYIKNSREHWHQETAELYLVLEVGPDGSQMVVGNEMVDLQPGMVILLPPGEANKHGGFGELQALMLFTPGLAKKGNNAERDEQETGVGARESAATLPKRDLSLSESEETPGGAIIAQIPPYFLGTPSAEPAKDETPFRRSIPGLSITAFTARGDVPITRYDNPTVTKIYLITGGEGQMLFGDRVQDIGKNDVILVPPNMEHALVPKKGAAVNVMVAYLSEQRDITAEDLEQVTNDETRPRIAALLSPSL